MMSRISGTPALKYVSAWRKKCKWSYENDICNLLRNSILSNILYKVVLQ